jgi:hypothetical protein
MPPGTNKKQGTEMDPGSHYPIGTPGQKWGAAERAEWLSRQRIKRSYAKEVLAKLEKLAVEYDRVQYGALSHDPKRYPLFAFRSRNWSDARPNVLITGGVHGYETSSPMGLSDCSSRRMASNLNSRE